ncbi:unnamed protein product [Lactuca saligna]|uniref:Uncharacterized protein n=1 Tax=Lactuca saligna TaxID=75948 RepID=A0AA36ENB7_LACSI|nr:unnamed protein product [Lactuca saligna]
MAIKIEDESCRSNHQTLAIVHVISDKRGKKRMGKSMSWTKKWKQKNFLPSSYSYKQKTKERKMETGDEVKVLGLDLSTVKRAGIAAYNRTSTAVTKVDQVVRVDGI